MTITNDVGRRAMEMGSDGWAVFDGPRMIASNLTEQDAQVLANADALLTLKEYADHKRSCELPEAGVRGICDCGFTQALAALPENLRSPKQERAGK